MNDGSVAPAPPVEGWPAESASRLEKLQRLRELGIEPWPNRFEPTHQLGDIVATHGGASLEDLEAAAVEVSIAGRVLTKRGHGKASFATLVQGGERLQIYVRLDAVGAQGYAVFDLVDRGDFVGVRGNVMRTRKGELSVQARELTFLGKALLPPPEKWHGLSDVELRYRQRYLDLVENPEVRLAFVTRSRVVAEIRRFLDEHGYLEVETPMMQPIAGGALARPFKTHHNALGVDLFLRIAPELYLKRLVVGGLERVYEINRNFRNEGISSQHNPEFTMLEFYTAWFDCRDVMTTTEGLVAVAARQASPEGVVEYRGRTLSFRTPFRRLRMTDAIAAALEGSGLSGAEALADPATLAAYLDSEGFRARCRESRVDASAYAALGHGKRVMQLFEDFVEHTLWEPTFVVDHPVEISPLAKARADDPRFADRFELFAGGLEIANGFSELNDPLEQRARFLDQIRQREGGDAEAHQMDDDYVRALGHGLPPTGGCGVGIDRLAMLLTDSASIRDVILFPHMRPREGRERTDESTGHRDHRESGEDA